MVGSSKPQVLGGVHNDSGVVNLGWQVKGPRRDGDLHVGGERRGSESNRTLGLYRGVAALCSWHNPTFNEYGRDLRCGLAQGLLICSVSKLLWPRSPALAGCLRRVVDQLARGCIIKAPIGCPEPGVSSRDPAGMCVRDIGPSDPQKKRWKRRGRRWPC